jgi:hypothetical protein
MPTRRAADFWAPFSSVAPFRSWPVVGSVSVTVARGVRRVYARLTSRLREAGGGGQRNNELLVVAAAAATSLTIGVRVGLVGLGEAGAVREC